MRWARSQYRLVIRPLGTNLEENVYSSSGWTQEHRPGQAGRRHDRSLRRSGQQEACRPQRGKIQFQPSTWENSQWGGTFMNFKLLHVCDAKMFDKRFNLFLWFHFASNTFQVKLQTFILILSPPIGSFLVGAQTATWILRIQQTKTL